MSTVIQNTVDQKNIDFWNELCGTGLAKSLNITDHTLPSLKKFDDAYLAFYPYLLKHVDLSVLRHKKVLEVGLGYGTLSQKIAEVALGYTGLDIAAGPVKMVNHRVDMFQLPGRAIQGSMLNCPLENDSQDAVVSIGCYHHTGNLQKCIDETFRVLKPGGYAMIMVYNKYSYRQWKSWPLTTLKAWYKEYLSSQIKALDVLENQRHAYDHNSANQAAPETQFTSMRELKNMFANFKQVSLIKENNDGFLPFKGKFLLKREWLLGSLGHWMGLDIYITAVK